MKLQILSFLFLSAISLHAAGESRLSVLRAADDERVAATIAADRARLDAIFSEDLRYAHSTGGVDGRAAFMEALLSGRTNYETIRYEERNFTFPVPGIALMTGRVRMHVINAGIPVDVALGFLAVWREEQGKWRFLAWQSCRLPEPATEQK